MILRSFRRAQTRKSKAAPHTVSVAPSDQSFDLPLVSFDLPLVSIDWRLMWLGCLVVVLALAPASMADTSSLNRGAQSTPLNGDAQSTTLNGGTQSTMLNGGTQSTTLQGGLGSTTLQTGTQSTTLQAGTGQTMLQTGATGALIQGGVEHQGGPVNILFLVDSSMSMKEKLEGHESKMQVAGQVLELALSRIPNDINVGLRVFGQGAGGYDDCRETALLVPLGQHNRSAIVERMRALRPVGLTPLMYALQQAAQDDLVGIQGTKTLILITDGADTCNGNPCEYIRLLPRLGIHLKVDIVGLDLKKDPNARAQLNCISEKSGGKYYDAGTAAQLIDSVSRSVDSAISGRIILKPGSQGKNTETPEELKQQHPMLDR